MELEHEIHTALEAIVDEILKNAASGESYARSAKPIPLRAKFKEFKRRMGEAFHDEWGFPWGLRDPAILKMDWSGFPGSGSTWSLSAIVLPSGRRLYIAEAATGWDDETIVVAGSSELWSPKDDRRVLQHIFVDNGAEIGGVLSSPPSHVFTSVGSFPFLIDLFVALFDAAGSECWGELMEAPGVWDEDYENPEDPIGELSDVEQKAAAEIIRQHGNPTNFGSSVLHQKRVDELAAALWLQEDGELLGPVRYKPRLASDSEAKVQMVARFLSRAVTYHPVEEPSAGSVLMPEAARERQNEATDTGVAASVADATLDVEIDRLAPATTWRPIPIPPKPVPENFGSEDEFEEALGFWFHRFGHAFRRRPKTSGSE